MKKSILMFFMGALFFVGLTSMVEMEPPLNSEICDEVCEFWVGVGVSQTWGSCMAWCNTCANKSQNVKIDAAHCFCKDLKDQGILKAAGVSFGECLQTFK